LKTCISTLLLTTKNSDMVDYDMADVEGLEGKTRDSYRGHWYLHRIEKINIRM